MSPEEFERHIDFVVEATGGVDLVNITGGEPTRHPQLIELLERARRPEIGRITVNTNGLTIARDPFLAQELARVGAYVILSFDTLEPQISQQIHGLD
ncbi:MAG: radical SAM protein, partial [Desulfobacterales bacterium CG23_combo_of_CG06-09_8_20_14_all_51_8]